MKYTSLKMLLALSLPILFVHHTQCSKKSVPTEPTKSTEFSPSQIANQQDDISATLKRHANCLVDTLVRIQALERRIDAQDKQIRKERMDNAILQHNFETICRSLQQIQDVGNDNFERIHHDMIAVLKSLGWKERQTVIQTFRHAEPSQAAVSVKPEDSLSAIQLSTRKRTASSTNLNTDILPTAKLKKSSSESSLWSITSVNSDADWQISLSQESCDGFVDRFPSSPSNEI